MEELIINDVCFQIYTVDDFKETCPETYKMLKKAGYLGTYTAYENNKRFLKLGEVYMFDNETLETTLTKFRNRVYKGVQK